jgi:mycoredoxin
MRTTFASGALMPDQVDLYSANPSQIVMYTTAWCPDCRRAKFFMKRKDIQFLEIDVNEDQKAESFVKKLSNGNRSVPTIIFPDGSIMVEPSTQDLEQKFNQN